MDPSISWLQPEQEGPAKVLWLRIWQTQQELDSLNIKDVDSDTDSFTNGFNNQTMNGKSDKSGSGQLYRRRKVENRPTTKLQKVVGEYGGAPWRLDKSRYGRGVVG